MLQCSRGISIGDNSNIDELADKVSHDDMLMRDVDFARADELDEVVGSEMKGLNFLVEMGFRVPRLLNYYKERGVKKVKGYDVVKFNVEVGNKLGFDTEVKDFNNLGLNLKDLNDVDLLLGYHVLEHLSRPDLVLANIYNNLKRGALLHLEIPIGPVVIPEVGKGHLFTFHPRDLGRILDNAGFKVLSAGFFVISQGVHGKVLSSKLVSELAEAYEGIPEPIARRASCLTERYVARKE